METNSKQLEYAKKYHAKFDDIKVRVVAGEREEYKKYALSHGWNSANEFIVQLVNYAMSHGLTAEDMRH